MLILDRLAIVSGATSAPTRFDMEEDTAVKFVQVRHTLHLSFPFMI
jgi:hypothetical protein